MPLRRSFSLGDVRPHVAAPAGVDGPALSPTDEPHRRNVADAENRPSLFALGLLPMAPVHHQAHEAGRLFRPPAVRAEPSAVTRLADAAGRAHPVFSQPVYMDFLRQFGQSFRAVRHGPNPGSNAGYIAELVECDASRFSASVVAPNGAVHSLGDATVFSVQSLCKQFILAAALRHQGLAAVRRALATQYSHQPFDGPSTVGLLRDPSLEAAALACRSPASTSALLALARSAGDLRFANASCNLGAIGTTMLLPQAGQAGGAVGRQALLMRLIGRLGAPRTDGAPCVVTAHKIHGSEIRDTAGNQLRARVAAGLLSGQGLPAGADLPLQAFRDMQAYIAACALSMATSGLAAAYSCFANGRNVFTEEQMFDAEEASLLLEQMKVGGLYQDSLRFFHQTGMVAKSGVGGGVVAICPVTGLTIAVHATRLDAHGNSARALRLLERLAASSAFAALRRACEALSSGP